MPLHARSTRIHPAVLVPVLVVAAMAAGCGGAVARGPSASTGDTTISAPPAGPPGAVRLGVTDSGRSVTVARGATVELVLDSTYWTVAPLPAATVLHADGAPVVAPAVGHCVAGQGCGTVTATWLAVAPGTVTVAAGRTVCGEALACRPDQRSFRVVVTVE